MERLVGGNGLLNANGNRANKGRERDEAPPNPKVRHLPFRKTEAEEIEHFRDLFRLGWLEQVQGYAEQLKAEGWGQEQIYSMMTQANFNVRWIARAQKQAQARKVPKPAKRKAA